MRCVISLLLLFASVLSVWSEVQECTPVSARPDGKIICTNTPSKDERSYTDAQGHPSSSAIQQIEQMIQKYGKDKIIDFIHSKKSGQITLYVGNGFRKYYGSPDSAYITPQTILVDLGEIGATPNELEKYIQEKAKIASEQASKKEQERKIAEKRAKDEAEERARNVVKDEKKASSIEVPRIDIPPLVTAPVQPDAYPKKMVRRGYTQQEWDAFCKSVGESAFAIAGARDRGMPATQGLTIVHNTFGELGDIYEQAARSVVFNVYENRWWSPTIAQQRMELLCLKAKKE